MVQVDLADQSQIGKRNANGVTEVFSSGPFKRKKFFRRSVAEQYADVYGATIFRRGWVKL